MTGIKAKHNQTQKNKAQTMNQNKTKWATFTYSGKETKQIIKLLKDTHTSK
jgi:hypothetical protein